MAASLYQAWVGAASAECDVLSECGTVWNARDESRPQIDVAVANSHLASAVYCGAGAKRIDGVSAGARDGVAQSRISCSTHAPGGDAPLQGWLRRVHDALATTGSEYPFLAYGTDWLAFAHLVIAIAFVGPLMEPVRNKWVLIFGVIACLGVFPLALIAGPIRGIPFYWRMIDCSFGLMGAVPLLICLRDVRRLERLGAAELG